MTYMSYITTQGDTYMHNTHNSLSPTTTIEGLSRRTARMAATLAPAACSPSKRSYRTSSSERTPSSRERKFSRQRMSNTRAASSSRNPTEVVPPERPVSYMVKNLNQNRDDRHQHADENVEGPKRKMKKSSMNQITPPARSGTTPLTETTNLF